MTETLLWIQYIYLSGPYSAEAGAAGSVFFRRPPRRARGALGGFSASAHGSSGPWKICLRRAYSATIQVARADLYRKQLDFKLIRDNNK